MQSLVFADLASVVLLLQNAHATCNARRIMCTTFMTIDVKLVDEAATLGTVELLLLLGIMW